MDRTSKRTELVNVEKLPRKLQALPFMNSPAFGETGIDSEVAVAAEVVSLAGLPGICVSNWR